jgi:hypothetical protein
MVDQYRRDVTRAAQARTALSGRDIWPLRADGLLARHERNDDLRPRVDQ